MNLEISKINSSKLILKKQQNYHFIKMKKHLKNMQIKMIIVIKYSLKLNNKNKIKNNNLICVLIMFNK